MTWFQLNVFLGLEDMLQDRRVWILKNGYYMTY